MHQTIQEILLIKDPQEAFQAFDDFPGYAKEKRLLRCRITEDVLGIFEKTYPDDSRPRNAMEMSRRFAHGEATEVDLRQAVNAAWAAWDDAWNAAWNAIDTRVTSVSVADTRAAAASAATSADSASAVVWATTTTSAAARAADAVAVWDASDAASATAWKKFHGFLRETLTQALKENPNRTEQTYP